MSATTGLDSLPQPATEPLPVLAARPTLRATFASLSIPAFRWYVTSLGLSSAGAWLARIATDWLIVELTGDVALVSIVVAAQLLPPMLVGAWGGVIGDRLSARRTVIAVQAVLAAAVLALAIPAIIGQASVALIVLTSLVIGLTAAFEAPSRAVFVVEVVSTRALPNAMGLNAAVQQCAGIVGSLTAAGAIAVVGAGWTMVIAAAGPLLGIVALSMIQRRDLHPAVKVPVRPGQVREALRYVKRKVSIRTSILLVASLALFGMTGSVLYAWAAREEFALGAVGYGLFQTAAAIGALVGSLLAARRRELRLGHNALLLAAASALWLVTGLAPTALLFAIGLVAALAARLAFFTANDALIQLSANGSIRARVVSLSMICATGFQAVGAVLTGWSVHVLGGQLTFIITGAVPLVIAVVVWVSVAGSARRAIVILPVP